MSNSLAIAVATRGLTSKLGDALSTSTIGAGVSAVRPTALTATQANVNAFLYQVTPNVALRNADLPTRRAGGELITRPQLALELHYLLTFTGDETDLIPQRLLGVVLPALHAQPSLGPPEIDRLVQLASPSFLDDSDLAQQVELVRFSLAAMNLEELSKLWSVFFQTPYLLSVPLQASVVLLEAPLTPSPAQLVRERGVYSGTPQAPRLATLSPPFAALPTLGASPEVTLTGSGFLGERTLVQFGAAEPQAPVPSNLEARRIVVTLPDSLQAGVHAVRVSVQHDFGPPGSPKLFDLDSNSLAFAVAPSIESESPLELADGVLSLEVAPPCGRDQAVRVILERHEPSMKRIAVNWTAPIAAPPDPIDQHFSRLQVSVPADLPAARYFVRIEVDGVGSVLTDDPDSLPFVDVPDA